MKKKNIAAFAVVVGAFVFTACVISGQKKSLVSQTMADRWSADGSEFAQISVFFPHVQSAGESDADFIGEAIKKNINEGAFVSSDNDPDNIWTDAYSSEAVTASVFSSNDGNTVIGENSSGKNADQVSTELSIIGIGGQFFDFHPLELLNGNYIYTDEIREDRVVLDEEAAWNLFSSLDIVGMNLWVNGTQFEVAGVVKHESEKVVKASYPSRPIMYIHYSMLDAASIKSPLVCYEAVMPNPVDNYAKNAVLAAYGIDTMASSQAELEKNIKALNVEVLDNTSRYSVSSLFTSLKKFGENTVVLKATGYPYWENAARILMSKLTIWFGAACLSGAAAIIMIIIFIAKLYLRRTWHLKDFIEKLTYKYTYKKKISDYINIDEKTSENK